SHSRRERSFDPAPSALPDRLARGHVHHLRRRRRRLLGAIGQHRRVTHDQRPVSDGRAAGIANTAGPEPKRGLLIALEAVGTHIRLRLAQLPPPPQPPPPQPPPPQPPPPQPPP